MKKFQIVLLALVLVAISCSKQREPLTLIIQWQKADSDACLACQHTGAQEQDIQKAFARLSKQLAAKGIRVELVEKKAVVDTSKPEIGSGQMWLGNVPVETWLGAGTDARRCSVCPAGPTDKGHLRKSLVMDGQVFDPIPVELMVRAGLTAADQMEQRQKAEHKN